METSPPGSAAAGFTLSILGVPFVFADVLTITYRPSIRAIHNPSAAYIPAIQSSAIIPQPPGSDSAWRAGNGFQMSNARKSIKPRSKYFQFSAAKAREYARCCPDTSSITTNCGSLLPENCAARRADHRPATAKRIAMGTPAQAGDHIGTSKLFRRPGENSLGKSFQLAQTVNRNAGQGAPRPWGFRKVAEAAGRGDE